MILPFNKIVVDKGAEAGFRRRALKAMPNEYMESLWGYMENGVAYICVFMPLTQKATPETVTYSPAEVESQKKEARRYSLHVLGSIHTHPDRDEAIFSEGDLRDLQNSPEMVMAVCAIAVEGRKRRRCVISYWPGVTPLPVEYTAWKDHG